MSSAGGSKKKRKAVVRKELGDTLEYESRQQNDTDVGMDETKEELSFVASAVSDSAGWHAPKFKCDRQWRKEGFKFYDIASIMVEDDGELHTIHFCTK